MKVIPAFAVAVFRSLPVYQELAHGVDLDRHGTHRETANGGVPAPSLGSRWNG